MDKERLDVLVKSFIKEKRILFNPLNYHIIHLAQSDYLPIPKYATNTSLISGIQLTITVD